MTRISLGNGDARLLKNARFSLTSLKNMKDRRFIHKWIVNAGNEWGIIVLLSIISMQKLMSTSEFVVLFRKGVDLFCYRPARRVVGFRAV